MREGEEREREKERSACIKNKRETGGIGRVRENRERKKEIMLKLLRSAFPPPPLRMPASIPDRPLGISMLHIHWFISPMK